MKASNPTRERQGRDAAIDEDRRDHIVTTARKLFEELGLNGASLRMIAARAGVTTGAIYPHFESKEGLYAEVLARSLDELAFAVSTARTKAEEVGKSTPRAALLAFFDFYAARPNDLALGLYLHAGLAPQGLTPSLDRVLNDKLDKTYECIRGALKDNRAASIDDTLARGIAMATGLLILDRTGRSRMMRVKSRDVFIRHLKEIVV